MSSRNLSCGAAILCAITGAAASAHAGIMVFTDRASWEGALGGAIAITEDFNALSPQIIADGDTIDTGLVQITRDGSPNGGDGLLEIEPGGNFGNLDGTTFLSGETGGEPHERVKVAFNGQDVFAFGADWFSPFSGDGIGIEVLGQLILLDSISGFDSGFVGVVSTDSFDSISIVGNPATESFQELWSADNFSYAVPAPGAAALFGLTGLSAARRRR